MATKEYKARVQNKRATSTAWELDNPVLLDGEMILVDMADGGVKKKYGDGVSAYSELAFDAGESGVYLGSEEPVDDNINVWIDTTDSDDSINPSDLAGLDVSGKTINEGTDSEYTGGLNAEVFNGANDDGIYNVASGDYSHAEGYITLASGNCSHAEGGYGVTASGKCSHAEGGSAIAEGDYSHAEGYNTLASGECSHVEGGFGVTASGECSHVEGGYGVTASGKCSHAEGAYGVTASGECSHAEGNGTEASGEASHAEGYGTEADGKYSHAEGYYSITEGDYSHAEGYCTTASGNCSHAEGGYTVIASGECSHAEGGCGVTASGKCSHAEGGYTVIASGECSHAEGAYGVTASGECSHAEGNGTEASGEASHAEGYGTTASGDCSHVQGKYNIADADGVYADIVGNGTADARANIQTLDWDGNAWTAGKYSQGGTPTEDNDLTTKVYTDAKLLEARTYINTAIAELIGESPDALDTLYELATALDNDPNFATTITNLITSKVADVNALVETAQDAADAAQTTADGKANVSHTHTMTQVSGTLPITKGGTGVTNMVGTDYGTSRPRGIAILSAEPATLGNGCVAFVYDAE